MHRKNIRQDLPDRENSVSWHLTAMGANLLVKHPFRQTR